VRAVQVISWDPTTPKINCYDGSGKNLVDHHLDDLNIKVYRGKFCTGSFTEGGYRPCPDSAVSVKFDQCPKCSFIPNQDCLFDPICDGELCDFPFCSKEHAIYLGFFNDLVKVGLTQTERVEKRAVEQGLDAHSVVATVGTRKRARELEHRLSKRLSIYQAPKRDEVIRRMVRGTDMEAIHTAFNRGRRELEKLGLEVGDLTVMEHEPIRGVFYTRDIVGVHRGTVKGARGKYLFYSKYVIDGRSMVGRHVDLSERASTF